MSTLIRSLIVQVLNEKIRSETFNINKFKKFDDSYQAQRYAAKTLELFGEGSSRIVYILSSSKVIKFAKHSDEEKGFLQNKKELEVFTDPDTKNVVAKIFDASSTTGEFDWIISELVRPFSESNTDEMVKALDITSDISIYTIFQLISGSLSLDRYRARLSPKALNFIEGMQALVRKHDLATADLEFIDHYGKTADGRVVCLDYGADLNLIADYY